METKETLITDFYLFDTNFLKGFIPDNRIDEDRKYIENLNLPKDRMLVTRFTICEILQHDYEHRTEAILKKTLKNIFNHFNLYLDDNVDFFQKKLNEYINGEIDFRCFYDFIDIQLHLFKSAFLKDLFVCTQHVLLVMIEYVYKIKVEDKKKYISYYNKKNNINSQYKFKEVPEQISFFNEHLKKYCNDLGVYDDTQVIFNKFKCKNKKQRIISIVIDFLDDLKVGKENIHNLYICYGYCVHLYLAEKKYFSPNDYIDIQNISLITHNCKVLTHDGKWIDFLKNISINNEFLLENYNLCKSLKRK